MQKENGSKKIKVGYMREREIEIEREREGEREQTKVKAGRESNSNHNKSKNVVWKRWCRGKYMTSYARLYVNLDWVNMRCIYNENFIFHACFEAFEVDMQPNKKNE